MTGYPEVERAAAAALAGGDASRYPAKMPVRDRVALLLDGDSWVEDGLLADSADQALAADGVLTGVGTVDGRPVAVIAHDFTVKAGSWGELTCEKQIRILLGPSAAGGAYMPAFTDWVGMVEGNASMYLASPRIAEKVTGEHTTLEEMGGALMHATVSGCGDEVFDADWQAIAAARLLLSYLPDSWRDRPLPAAPAEPEFREWPDGLIPADPNAGYDVVDVILRLADSGSFFEIKIAAIEDEAERAEFVAARIAEQEADFTLLRMGSELVVDTVIQPDQLRTELLRRLRAAAGWERTSGQRHHLISPV